MKSINEDIKNQSLKQVYLLYGEEDYLKKKYRDKLKAAFLPQEDKMNYAYFEGKNIDPMEIIGLAETMPFFADLRLIVVENSGFFKNACQELADYMKEPAETVRFIFVEQQIDKRGRLYKAVGKLGRAVEMKVQDEKSLLPWIGGKVRKEHKQIKESTARYLLSKVGTDMTCLDQELEKLFSYTMEEQEITIGHIDDICTPQLLDKVFAMVEAVALKQQKKALDYYYDLLALRESPMKILYLLVRQFRILLDTKFLVKGGASKSLVASELSVAPFVADKYMSQCRSFTENTLKEILEEGASLEEMVKTGRLNDRMSVELFIVKYSK